MKMMKKIPSAATVAVLSLTFAAAPAPAAVGHSASKAAPVTVTAASASGDLATMRRLINQARRRAGRPALRPNRVLRRAAALKLRRIAACGQFTHTPCGAPFTATFRAAGWRRGTMGENIAFGSSSLGAAPAIFQSWMNSPGHRANIMSRAFRYEGLAVRTVSLPGIGSVRVWAQAFGR
jgi:uncharacterized protein YkwD